MDRLIIDVLARLHQKDFGQHAVTNTDQPLFERMVSQGSAASAPGSNVVTRRSCVSVERHSDLVPEELLQEIQGSRTSASSADVDLMDDCDFLSWMQHYAKSCNGQ